ncbi:MAG: glycosyltransferase [Bacteroidota bacterium]
MKTILITAYAINPYKGSEDGTGWNITCQIAKHNKVIAITRKNNREHIDRYLSENDFPGKDNLSFAYFDTPYWTRFWKKGGRGAMLYHYLWQFGVVGFIRKQNFEFDIAHGLNFHCDWSPSFLWRLKKPFVWGPIGHHHKIPSEYILKVYGRKEWLKDRLRWWVKQFFWTVDPFLKVAVRKAEKVIAINSSVGQVLDIPEHKLVRMPAVASEYVDYDPSSRRMDQFEILSIGRFVPLKGFDITIRSFATFYHRQPEVLRSKLKLTLVGKGPYKSQLKNLAKALNVENAVEIIEWIEREKLMDIYRRADLYFFPSHEGAGMVVPEAMSFGLPIVCFDNYGPGEFVDESCSIKVPYSTYATSVQAFADALKVLFEQKDLKNMLGQGARNQYERQLTWEAKGKLLRALYDQIEPSYEESRLYSPVQ